MKSRNFKIGFVVGLVLFCAINLYSYYRMPAESTMDDGSVYFGWPFWLYGYGGFWTHSFILWTGLIGDVIVALCAGGILGWAFDKFFGHRAAEQIVGPERG